MPDLPTASSQEKQRRQKTEHAPCSVSTGPCPRVSRKDKLIEDSVAHHGAVPSGHGGVVSFLQTHFLELRIAINEERDSDGHGAVPSGHRAVPELLFSL
ncbi:hypothetical protein HanRHA438_Chr05g0232311 [Helianthus annuus]|nr:hypothetical protein HanRHA438_Chr05g0232311 [Helianthus annuus]